MDPTMTAAARAATATASIIVPVDADAAFRTITDLSRLPEWNARMTRVVELPDRLEAGAEWVVEFEAFGQTWLSRSRLETVDSAARRFAYRAQTDDGNPSFADWRWQVEPVDGGCRVTVSWDLHPATFWRRLLLARIRARQLQRSEIPASLAALAEAARKSTDQKGDTVATRSLQCPCGIVLTGADNEDLFRLGRQHADEHHPDDHFTDEYIRDYVTTNARDADVA